MKDAVLVGQVRGDDSVGIGWIGADTTDVGVHKDTLPASSFLTTKKSLEVVGDADGNYFTMVHHRAKTIGDVTVAAAQPFHYVYGPTDARKDIIVAHNGTLTNHKMKEGNIKFVSDSDWLAWKLADAKAGEDGVLDLADVLDSVSGAYSVVVATTTHVYFANNGKRPMSVAITKCGTGLLFASEAGMLSWLIERNEIKAEAVYTLEPFTLYRVPITAGGKITIEEEFIEDYSAYYGTGSVTSMYPRTTAGTRAQSLDEWYKTLTGKDPTPPSKATKPPTVINGDTGQITPTAVSELIGLNVSCMFNEIDVNKNVAYGIGWIDQQIVDELSVDAAHVIHTGGVMMEGKLVLPALDANTVYIGKIEGLCTVQEMEAGVLIKRPYVMIKEESLREESPGEGKDAMAAIGKYATV